MADAQFTAGSALANLPLDLILRIANKLDPMSAVRLHATCRDFKHDAVIRQTSIGSCMFCGTVVTSFDAITDIIVHDMRPDAPFQGNKSLFYKLATRRFGQMKVHIKVARIQWGQDYIYKVIFYKGCRELFGIEHGGGGDAAQGFGLPEIRISEPNIPLWHPWYLETPIPLALIYIGALWIGRMAGYNAYDVVREGRFSEANEAGRYEWFWKLVDAGLAGMPNTRKLYKAIVYNQHYHTSQ